MSDDSDQVIAKLEVVKVQSVSAYFSNCFHIAVGPQYVRISFGESIMDKTCQYRTAVVLALADVFKLVNMLVLTSKAEVERQQNLMAEKPSELPKI